MITVYGITASRAARVLWMLEELGLPYEQAPVRQRTEDTRTPEYRALNPNGRVPALKDGDTVLFESLAINLYLADAHGGGLWAGTPAERGLAYQWSLWAVTEMEDDLLTCLLNRFLRPEDQRDAAAGDKAEAALHKPLAVLDGVLAQRDWLATGAFSVADLNVAAVLSWARPGKVALDAVPNVQRWLEACLGRPAWQRVLERRAAEQR